MKKSLTIHDVINNYPQLKKDSQVFPLYKRTEMLIELRTLDYDFNDKEIENIKLFFVDELSDDVLYNYITLLVDEDYNFMEDFSADEKSNKFILSLLRDKRFKNLTKFINNIKY